MIFDAVRFQVVLEVAVLLPQHELEQEKKLIHELKNVKHLEAEKA